MTIKAGALFVIVWMFVFGFTAATSIHLLIEQKMTVYEWYMGRIIALVLFLGGLFVSVHYMARSNNDTVVVPQ